MARKPKCEVNRSDFKRDQALTKTKEIPAIYGSSIPLQCDPPQFLNPSYRRPKRDWSSFGRQTKRSSSSKGLKRSPNAEVASRESAFKPTRFTKIMRSQGTHATKSCKLWLPREFFIKNKVTRSMTMTDSAGEKLWPMHCQRWGWYRSPKVCVIHIGWREFSREHGLNVNDRLVFTLVSPSHFVVEFATSSGSPRAMFPTTKDGDNSPCSVKSPRLDCLPPADLRAQLQATKEKLTRKKTQVDKNREVLQKVALTTTPNKQKPQTEIFCQCNKVGEGKNTNSNSRKEFVFPMLTHLECKYPDGSPYFQIIESDCEILDEDDD